MQYTLLFDTHPGSIQHVSMRLYSSLDCFRRRFSCGHIFQLPAAVERMELKCPKDIFRMAEDEKCSILYFRYNKNVANNVHGV